MNRLPTILVCLIIRKCVILITSTFVLFPWLLTQFVLTCDVICRRRYGVHLRNNHLQLLHCLIKSSLFHVYQYFTAVRIIIITVSQHLSIMLWSENVYTSMRSLRGHILAWWMILVCMAIKLWNNVSSLSFLVHNWKLFYVICLASALCWMLIKAIFLGNIVRIHTNSLKHLCNDWIIVRYSSYFLFVF